MMTPPLSIRLADAEISSSAYTYISVAKELKIAGIPIHNLLNLN
jgi:hypothetical protein